MCCQEILDVAVANISQTSLEDMAQPSHQQHIGMQLRSDTSQNGAAQPLRDLLHAPLLHSASLPLPQEAGVTAQPHCRFYHPCIVCQHSIRVQAEHASACFLAWLAVKDASLSSSIHSTATWSHGNVSRVQAMHMTARPVLVCNFAFVRSTVSVVSTD